MISGRNTVSIRITNGRIFKASSLRRATVAISNKSPDSVTLAVITSLTVLGSMVGVGGVSSLWTWMMSPMVSQSLTITLCGQIGTSKFGNVDLLYSCFVLFCLEIWFRELTK